MAVNVALENLSKTSIKSAPSLAPNRLEINDAVGESVRIYIRNIRFEFTVDDFLILSDMFSDAKDNSKLFLGGSSSNKKSNQISANLFLFLKRTYSYFSFLERLPLLRAFIIKRKHYLRNKLATSAHGGLCEISRVFLDEVILKLSKHGKMVILRKYESLPYSVHGGDIDFIFLGEVEKMKEVFSDLSFREVEQIENGVKVHIHFFRLDQHYDCSSGIVINSELFNNYSDLHTILITGLNLNKIGFYTLSNPALVFHLIDSIVEKYQNIPPQYYLIKIEQTLLTMSGSQVEQLLYFIDFAKSEHRKKMINILDTFTLNNAN